MALYSLHRKTERFPSIYVYTEILANPVNGIYTVPMDIVYDAEKSESNTAKHGMSLAEATRSEWDDALIWSDERKSYGEVRLCALGYIDLRLYYIVYVLRDNVHRIISLRKANSREVKRYAQA